MDDDVVGVAAEGGDVFLNPFEEHALVQEAGVEVAVLSEMFAGQETPEADAVVEVDHDDVVA